MQRALSFGYGIFAYLVFLVSFLYAIGFVGNVVVPKGIDDGANAGPTSAVVVNLLLLGLFVVQHSGMARPGFKRWWTKIIPKPVERSTYVLLSSVVLLLLFWLWQPIGGMVWRVEGAGAYVLWAIFGIGWATVLLSTVMIGHWNLFGLEQVYSNLKSLEPRKPSFVTPGLYKLVRHPIMVGFIIAFWATPEMSWGHFLFAGASTLYIVAAIQLEERDLITELGERYKEYRKQVPALIPIPKSRSRGPSEDSTG